MTKTPSLIHATTRAANLFAELNRNDVLNHLNAEEADIIATLFEALSRPDIATHVRLETWLGEDTTDRDPLPWISPDGTRHPDGPHHPTSYTFRPRHLTE